MRTLCIVHSSVFIVSLNSSSNHSTSKFCHQIELKIIEMRGRAFSQAIVQETPRRQTWPWKSWKDRITQTLKNLKHVAYRHAEDSSSDRMEWESLIYRSVVLNSLILTTLEAPPPFPLPPPHIINHLYSFDWQMHCETHRWDILAVQDDLSFYSSTRDS